MKDHTIGENKIKFVSKDLKDRIIKKYLDNNMTKKEVAVYYDISVDLVKKILKINRKGDSLEQKIRKRTKKLQIYHVDLSPKNFRKKFIFRT